MNNNETLLTKAYHNLRCAEDIYKMEEGDEAFLNYCGYHLQQAVELSIKYTLEINGITPPFLHDIEQLIYVAKENNIDLFLTDYVSDHAEMFSSWEAKTRYVLNFRVEKEKIETAIKEVGEYLQNLTKEQEKENFKKNIYNMFSIIDEEYSNIYNWQLSKDTLIEKIEDIFIKGMDFFLDNLGEKKDDYLQYIPEEYKNINLEKEQIYSNFLYDEIVNKFGTAEELVDLNLKALLSNQKQTEKKEEEEE